MIIGILGHVSAGKDTMADYLCGMDQLQKIAIADPMKRICMDLFGFTIQQLWGPSEERNKPDMRIVTKGGYLTPRKALRDLGMAGRALHEDVWVNRTLTDTKEILRGCSYSPHLGVRNKALFPMGKSHGVVISDVRFPNEVRRIREDGGAVVKLKRAGFTGAVAGHELHVSETAVDEVADDEVDIVFNAPEGVDNLYPAIDKLYPRIRALCDRSRTSS